MAFVNLSNHKVSTWSKEQLTAAEQLGYGDVVELDEGMPFVPVDTDETMLTLLAISIMYKLKQVGCTAVFLATEYKLTSMLLKYCRKCNIACYMVEMGELKKESPFKFVLWCN